MRPALMWLLSHTDWAIPEVYGREHNGLELALWNI